MNCPALQTRGHVLIVEDDDDIRETLRDILESEGYNVSVAADGQIALEILAAETPNLIILDLMMPVMDGWQFRTVQMSDSRLNAIPTLIVSADGNVQLKAEKLTAQGFIRKPVELKVLLEEVAKHCQRA